MGLEGLGADGWRHSPKNRGHPQRPAPDDQKAKIFATLASIPPPFSCDASWRRDPRAGGRRIRISPARSRRTSSLPAVIGYHCLPPRRIGSLRRFNFPRHSVIAHEARGPDIPNDGCQRASPQVGGGLGNRAPSVHPRPPQSAEACNSAASRGQDKSVHIGIETMLPRIGDGPVMQSEVGQNRILRLQQ
jgi:hypothetical protein